MGMKVLLVLNKRRNLDLLRNIFESKDHEVIIAENGVEAMETAAAFSPHLILLDVLLPGIDGLDTCRQLKKDGKTKNIPVIFLTAKTGQEYIIEAFEIGGVDYISEPFHQAEVLAKSGVHLKP